MGFSYAPNSVSLLNTFEMKRILTISVLKQLIPNCLNEQGCRCNCNCKNGEVEKKDCVENCEGRPSELFNVHLCQITKII